MTTNQSPEPVERMCDYCGGTGLLWEPEEEEGLPDQSPEGLADELFAIVKCTRHEDDALEFLTTNYEAILTALRDHTGAGDALLRKASEELHGWADYHKIDGVKSLAREIDSYLSRTTDPLSDLQRLGQECDREPFDRKAVLEEAAKDVLAERERQKSEEGWAPEHDDEHADTQLAGAAVCYTLASVTHWAAGPAIQQFWPWDDSWWKPGDARRNLVKAGALILAEIERLDRALSTKNGEQGEAK